MFGIGCIEGEVRARIEANKNKPTSEKTWARVLLDSEF